jgi:hypothetical protein
VTPIPLDKVWFAPPAATLSPINDAYILYVGNANLHKNLPILLDAYDRACRHDSAETRNRWR